MSQHGNDEKRQEHWYNANDENGLIVSLPPKNVRYNTEKRQKRVRFYNTSFRIVNDDLLLPQRDGKANG